MIEEDDVEYSRFRSDFAVRVAAVLDVPAGNTSIRLSCPGRGGLFLGSELVYTVPSAANTTVRFRGLYLGLVPAVIVLLFTT